MIMKQILFSIVVNICHRKFLGSMPVTDRYAKGCPWFLLCKLIFVATAYLRATILNLKIMWWNVINDHTNIYFSLFLKLKFGQWIPNEVMVTFQGWPGRWCRCNVNRDNADKRCISLIWIFTAEVVMVFMVVYFRIILVLLAKIIARFSHSYYLLIFFTRWSFVVDFIAIRMGR